MQVVAYGLLGGVSFAFPGADDSLLGSPRHNFSQGKVAVANAAFLGIGIVSGLLLGANCKVRNYGKVLKTLFVITTVALSTLAAVAAAGALPNAEPRPFITTIILFALIGAPSLGFIGLGIEAAALYPAGGAYVCFTIEGLVQVVGALLNQYANEESGFAIIATVSWVATLLLLFGYHEHRPEDEVRSEHAGAESRTDVAAAPRQPEPDPAG